MIPCLFPPTVQTELLSRLIHRDLSNPEHQTNLHTYYDVTYPEDSQNASGRRSFFADNPARVLHPKDPDTHSSLSVQNVLEKKLRWASLCGNNDTNARVDTPGTSPTFPSDIAQLLRAAFPGTDAYSATLNFSSGGDSLSAHREVNDDRDVGLFSVNFGCDGLFLISDDDGNGCEVIRLRSGDAVYMNGSSRLAWHGVPRILPSTCPGWLADWPSLDVQGSDPDYSVWKGWMSAKQVNLTVRQRASSAL